MYSRLFQLLLYEYVCMCTKDEATLFKLKCIAAEPKIKYFQSKQNWLQTTELEYRKNHITWLESFLINAA